MLKVKKREKGLCERLDRFYSAFSCLFYFIFDLCILLKKSRQSSR